MGINWRDHDLGVISNGKSHYYISMKLTKIEKVPKLKRISKKIEWKFQLRDEIENI